MCDVRYVFLRTSLLGLMEAAAGNDRVNAGGIKLIAICDIARALTSRLIGPLFEISMWRDTRSSRNIQGNGTHSALLLFSFLPTCAVTLQFKWHGSEITLLTWETLRSY